MPVRTFYVELSAWVERYNQTAQMRSDKVSVVSGEVVTLFAKLLPRNAALTVKSGTVPKVQLMDADGDAVTPTFASPVDLTDTGTEGNAILGQYILDTGGLAVGVYAVEFTFQATASHDSRDRLYHPRMTLSVEA